MNNYKKNKKKNLALAINFIKPSLIMENNVLLTILIALIVVRLTSTSNA